jgi:O-antigen/teichoic acid export membrane protein
VVIGRLFGAALVGVYSVGWEIGTLTSTELVEPLTAALFAGFSEAKRIGTNVSEAFFKAISATFLLTLPMGVGMSLLADPVIHLAFGSRWVAAVPLVQVFALVCTLKVIAYFSAVLLNSQGLIYIQFRISCVSTVVRIVLLLLLVGPFGLMGAAMAVCGCIAVEEVLFLIYTFRRFNLRALDLVRGTWRCVLATVVMAGVVYWQGIGWAAVDDSAGAEVRALVVGTLTGAATYTVVLLLAWWSAGRPRGAETVFLGVLNDTFRPLLRAGRLRSRSAG